MPKESLYFWVVRMKQQMVLVHSVARSVSAAVGQRVVKSVGQLAPEEVADLEQHPLPVSAVCDRSFEKNGTPSAANNGSMIGIAEVGKTRL
jgi:hypothetical protein